MIRSFYVIEVKKNGEWETHFSVSGNFSFRTLQGARGALTQFRKTRQGKKCENFRIMCFTRNQPVVREERWVTFAGSWREFISKKAGNVFKVIGTEASGPYSGWLKLAPGPNGIPASNYVAKDRGYFVIQDHLVRDVPPPEWA